MKAHMTRYEELVRYQSASVEPRDVITFGPLRIDRMSRRVFVDEEEKKLTAKEFSLLFFLATHPNRVFSKEELFHQIWGYTPGNEMATLVVHIRKIREKIEKDKQRQIDEYTQEMANCKENEISVCELEARNKVLAEKQKWIQKVKRDVQSKIDSTNGKEYVTLIQTMLDNAEPKSDCVVLLPNKEREEITNFVKQKGLEVQNVENFDAGFVLRYGNIEENYVLDTMIELQEEKIDEMIVKILFG